MIGREVIERRGPNQGLLINDKEVLGESDLLDRVEGAGGDVQGEEVEAVGRINRRPVGDQEDLLVIKRAREQTGERRERGVPGCEVVSDDLVNRRFVSRCRESNRHVLDRGLALSHNELNSRLGIRRSAVIDHRRHNKLVVRNQEVGLVQQEEAIGRQGLSIRDDHEQVASVHRVTLRDQQVVRDDHEVLLVCKRRDLRREAQVACCGQEVGGLSGDRARQESFVRDHIGVRSAPSERSIHRSRIIGGRNHELVRPHFRLDGNAERVCDHEVVDDVPVVGDKDLKLIKLESLRKRRDDRSAKEQVDVNHLVDRRRVRCSRVSDRNVLQANGPVEDKVVCRNLLALLGKRIVDRRNHELVIRDNEV